MRATTSLSECRGSVLTPEELAERLKIEREHDPEVEIITTQIAMQHVMKRAEEAGVDFGEPVRQKHCGVVSQIRAAVIQHPDLNARELATMYGWQIKSVQAEIARSRGRCRRVKE